MVHLKGGSRPPRVGLGAAVWLQIASGNAYNFPLYSHSLKSVLEFSQQQLTMLGVANDIGENVGILPGIACNKFSPWIVVLIGAFASFLGYGVLWLVVSQTVQSLPYWLLWLALCVATNSGAWLGTAVLITNMRNFPVSRGTVAGILKGYVGLSAAVYTEIFGILLHNSSAKLLLFLTLRIPTLCIVMMYAVKPCTPASGEDSAEHSHFLFIQVAILSHFIPLSDTVSYTFLVIMVLLLMAPLAIPVKMTLYPSNRSKLGTLGRPVGSSDQLIQAEGDVDKSEPLLTPSTSTTNIGSFHESDSVSELRERAVKKKRRPKRGEDFTFREAIVKADIWLLFFVYFASVGSGVTILNNLAQIGIAQGAEDTTVLLSLFSFFNFVGWLGGGIVSEHFVRTIWMTFTQIIMIITYLLFASALDGTLYVATAVLGMCYGFQFLTMVPTISKLFGLKHFGMIFNFMSLGNPLCVLLFSGFLAGFVYDSEAAKQHGTSCLLPNCFRLAFIILARVCALGTVLSVVLTK
ncbi:hypothetical protein HYC85_016995 [Camellia sinensis]|uniref:Nodulin-like domain-containing protein n=1 Tax=Camellia sinensis TaxID=4442 RepID=A0A7J7H2G1_CAMSI|nr:hypothetical protein HYC85_016995 [Camellia sinensis]